MDRRLCWQLRLPAAALLAFGSAHANAQNYAPKSSTNEQHPQAANSQTSPAPPAKVTQSAPAAAANSANGRSGTGELGEIVVTARRRAESGQRVPIAITAFNQQALDRQNVQDINDLQHQVPSMSVSGQTNDMLYVNIRGQGHSSQVSQAGVVVYSNEVPICCDNNGQTIGGPGLFYDLENVQVLKGPQGTLFGRNAMGGALLLQSQRPTGEFGGYLQGTLGNLNDRELTGAVNIPIDRDRLALRVAGFWQNRDGYTKSLGTGNHPNGTDLDNSNVFSGRVTLAFRPTDEIDNELIYQHFHSANHGFGYLLSALNPGFGSSLPGFAALFQQQQSLGIGTEIATSAPSFSRTNYNSLTDILKINLSPDLTFRNIASWSRVTRGLGIDYDASAYPILDFPESDQNDKQITEEAQLQGKSINNRLVWTVGSYLSSIPHRPLALQNNIEFFGPLVNGLSVATYNSKAVYTQGTYDLSALLKGLNFTAGFRYTWDKQTEEVYTLDANLKCVTPLPGSDANCRAYSAGSWSAPAWNLSLDYHFSPKTMVYVASRHAYRTGGFNTHPDSTVTSGFGPEYVTDVELGLKSDWSLAGMPVRTNAALYKQWYRDIQVSLTEIVSGLLTPVTVNGAKADIEGVELESTIVPFKGLELTGYFAYLKFKYTQFAPNALPSDIAALQATKTADRPPYKFGASAQYTTALPGYSGSVSFGGNYDWQSDSGDTRTGGTVKRYGQLNLNAAWNNFLRRPVDLSVFVNNALNLRRGYPTLVLYDSGLFNVTRYLPPRTFGVRVRVHF